MKTHFLLLILLTLPALAQPWQKPILVVPGKSLGPIELGKPVPKSAYQLLGPAVGQDQVLANQSKDGAGLEWTDKKARMGEPYIRVKCHDGIKPENVYQIFWTASGPRTKAGVGVGSPLAKVQQSFPKGAWTTGMDDEAVWKTPGLNFIFDSKKTRVLEMHLPARENQ